MKPRQHRGIVIMTLLLAFAFCFPVIAGEKKITKKDVPAAVLNAFKQSYPKAKAKGFAKETENGTTYYEVESVEGKTTRDLLYLEDGTVAEIEESVTVKDLPDAVAKAFAKESPKKHAVKIEKTTRGDVVTYDFTMGKGKSELVIDPSGKVLKHSQSTKANEENEENEGNEAGEKGEK